MDKTDREVFVVMPFGEKHFLGPTGTLQMDFDRVYRELIKPAAESIGFTVSRIDDLSVPGVITEQYLRRLFEAAVVIADVSMPNGNVFYELGIRHAISTGLTVMIALEGTVLPFDIAHQRVLFYRSGKFEHARGELASAIRSQVDEVANPVRDFLERLGTTTNAKVDGAAFAQDLASRVQRAKTVDQLIAIWGWARHQSPLPALGLLQLAERMSEFSAWGPSVEVLRQAVALRPQDFEIHRTLGWHLRHQGPAFEDEALAEFNRALELNTQDPETLGMMGGLLKRRREFGAAAKCYEDAQKVSPTSLYSRVNRAAMLVLAQPATPEDGIAQYRVLLDELRKDIEASSDPWSEVVAGEAAFALSRDSDALEHYRRARSLSRTGEELRSAADQLALFAELGFRPEAAGQMAAQLRAMWAPPSVPATVTVPAPEHVAPDTPVILHLSDIHFGSKPGKEGPVDMYRFYNGDYERPLHEHLIAEFCSKSAHFEQDHHRFVLVVSGDLTYQGTPAEFERVHEFLEALCTSLSLPRERVILVPGNHDVNWPMAKIDVRWRFDNYLAFLRKFYGEDLFRKRYPLVKWNMQVDDIRPVPEELIALYHHEGLTLVGLNSCVYETEQHHYGFVGGKQLDNIKKLLEQTAGAASDLRVAVLHHHLHPFPEPIVSRTDPEIWMDLSTIRDAGLVERRLEKLGFDLVLHGHKHKPQLRETLVHEQVVSKSLPPRMFVCGAGSAGVNASELEHATANHYAMLELLRLPRAAGAEFLAVEWRELALTPGAEWTTSRRWVLNG
jgi:3',5'-cyclic AMP phosphodiesterase CpdA/tetratricopeptide (TPR) repeat protein